MASKIGKADPEVLDLVVEHASKGVQLDEMEAAARHQVVGDNVGPLAQVG